MDIVTQINRAVEFVKNKEYKQAEKIYSSLLEVDSENPIILTLVGCFYLETKKPKKAEIFFEKAYQLTHSVASLSGLAYSKYILRKYEECVIYYKDLIQNEKKYEYYEKLTTAFSNLIALGKKEYSDIAYHIALDGVNKYPLKKELLLNLSIAALYSGRFLEAEKYCIDAIKQDSKYAKAYSQMGLIQECLYCDEERAQENYRKAIKLGIGHSGFYDMGISLSKSGKYSQATMYFKKALKLLPNNEIIKLALAFNYFKERKFKQGYKYYIQQNDSSDVRNLKKSWDGKAHKSSTIFVYPDLAFGDHIMFMRYVPFLKEKFKKIKVFVYPQLEKLFKENFSDIEFTTKIPRYDFSCALSKLPYYLKMDFNNIPFSEGYLDVDDQCIKSKKNKIGICWEAGNSDIRSTIHRSININEFKKLFELDVDFYSFQVNPSSDDYKKFKLKDLGKDFKDFYDTASALKSMDIIISVDTSVANLAGAMGIKTFLLLPYYSDWRWFDNIEKTEWYDSVKIFKQTDKSNWVKEIESIISLLKK